MRLSGSPWIALPLLSSTALAQVPFFDVAGSGEDRLGFSVAPAGDANGDGITDLVVGAPQAFEGSPPAAFGAGFVRVYSGADGVQLLEVHGSLLGDAFGFSVDGVGDIDGDGRDDFAVGAPQFATEVLAGGYVRIFSGADGSLIRSLEGAEPGERAGEVVRGLGDMDGDGTPDLLLTAPLHDHNGIEDRGLVVVVSGATGGTLAFHRAGSEHRLGTRAFAGHFDQDGLPDYAALALAPTGPYLRVWSGATFTERATFQPLLAQACVGDMTGDGVEDFADGLSIHSGADGSLAFGLWQPINNYPFFQGNVIAGRSDVDGDGTLDVLAGSSFGFQHTGVISGATGEMMFNLGHSASAVTGLGDLDGDGFDDFALGYTNNVPQFHAGHLRVFRGGVPAPTSSYCIPGDGILTFSGTTSLSANELEMQAIFVPQGQFGVLFFGDATQDMPFGQGRLCVGGQTVRVGPPVSIGPSFTPIPLDFTAPPFQSGVGLVAPGDTRYFQFWFRSPPSFSLTRALEVTFGV